MATTGALGNYYVDSFLLGADAADELGAGRYAPGALGQPPRQAAALAEHPDFSPCSFQSKAAVFGASWNPVHAAGANAVPAAVYHHHHHHPYVHPQAPVAAAAPDGRYMRSWLEPTPGALSFAGLPSSRPYGIKPEPLSARRGDCPTLDTHTLSLTDYACGSPPVDREKQPSEGTFPENNAENESSGDKPPIDPSKCLLPPDRSPPPPPSRPPGSAGTPAFSRACLRPRWEPPKQGPGARSCCLGRLGWGLKSTELCCDNRARGTWGEGRRLLPREGAGQVLRAEPRSATRLPGCPGPGQRHFGSFFESSAAESLLCGSIVWERRRQLQPGRWGRQPIPSTSSLQPVAV